MAPCRQATGTYRAHVTQTEYADAHRIYLCVIHAIRWPELMFASCNYALGSSTRRRCSAVCRQTKFRVSK
ncbi:hypothetical protein PCL1606_50700 [Pseudomonas chlororaphis]|uniref:Uncharacterized protein n=1 Tax=Pseudomonas chlororaphis TaxID=587753 RepID=A0A0D5Y6B0_9PSED|nr:hypothetical protein PCL1606_50700 [Pseudomonas chlororaphis]